MAAVVLGLEVLGLVLVAAGAGVGVAVLAGVWAGLLVAGAVVLAGAARGQNLMEGGVRGAVVRPSAPRTDR